MNVLNGYRNNRKELSSDESENSDNECFVWKRAVKNRDETEAPMNVQPEELPPIPTEKPKHRKNTIWSDILQDQLISEDLSSCLLGDKPAHYESRGQESYDYTLKYADSEINKESDVAMSEETPIESDPNFVSSHRNYKCKKFVKLDGAERAAAVKINKVLHEKKFYLIQRIVKYVGIEKAMTLLRMTEDIEDSGGMMINNNTRRRTPGGVYIQLLKNDKDVTKEMQDKIFEGEMSAVDMKKFYAEKKKQRKVKKHKISKAIMAKKDKKKNKNGDSRLSCDSAEIPKDAPTMMNTDEPTITDEMTSKMECIQQQKTEFEDVNSMEVTETCDEAAPNNDTVSMENCSTLIPAPPAHKSDSELEEGEIDD